MILVSVSHQVHGKQKGGEVEEEREVEEEDGTLSTGGKMSLGKSHRLHSIIVVRLMF